MHVEVGADITPRHDLDADFAGLGQHDGAVRQSVRCNGGHDPAAHGWVHQGATDRQRICGGPCGRSDDQAVGALVGHKPPVDLDPQLDHARGAPPIDHHIVHGQRAEHAALVTHDVSLQQAAVLGLVVALKHGQQHRLVALQGNVGDEAQPPLVDAHQRQAMTGHLTAYAEHGAVASYHQAQIALRADLGHLQHRVLVQAGVRSGFLVQHHIAALPGQELCHVVQSTA